MEYANDKRGRRSKKESSLYMAAVNFTYAVWENFVEELAIELANRVADEAEGLRAHQLNRPEVRAFIED